MQRAFSFREDAILDTPIKHPPRVTSLALEHALVQIGAVPAELAEGVGVGVARYRLLGFCLCYIVTKVCSLPLPSLSRPIQSVERAFVVAAQVMQLARRTIVYIVIVCLRRSAATTDASPSPRRAVQTCWNAPLRPPEPPRARPGPLPLRRPPRPSRARLVALAGL